MDTNTTTTYNPNLRQRFHFVATLLDGRKVNLFSRSSKTSGDELAAHASREVLTRYVDRVDSKTGVTLTTWHNGHRTYQRQARRAA